MGKGRFIMGDDLEMLLQAAAVRKETMAAQGLQCIRRKDAGGRDIYFIANRSNKKLETWVPLQTKANGVALYNPMTGQSGIARSRKNAAGYTEVFLQFNTDESYILQLQPGAFAGTAYPYINATENPVEISGEWTLQFTEGGPSLPAPVKQTALQPWTMLADNSYKIFSGTGVYSTGFKKPSGTAGRFLLNLGKVYESAEVLINGKSIAKLLGPDYEVVIPASLLKADNLLEIKVANSMANRIIDLDKRNVTWKKFNNTNFPARLPQNRGAGGIFDASKWEPKVSGLAGPVTLTAVKN